MAPWDIAPLLLTPHHRRRIRSLRGHLVALDHHRPSSHFILRIRNRTPATMALRLWWAGMTSPCTDLHRPLLS
jgi:hypothetical protein